jgi:hypothetical protein
MAPSSGTAEPQITQIAQMQNDSVLVHWAAVAKTAPINSPETQWSFNLRQSA